MTDFLLDSLVFSAKATFVFLLFVLCTVIVTVIAIKMMKKNTRNIGQNKRKISIENLTETYKKLKDQVAQKILDDKDYQELKKQQTTKEKNKKSTETQEPPKKRLFVITFDGDIKASQAENLGYQIDAILSIAEANDEVLIKLTSPGGAVTGYGLAASQLARLRDHGIKLTVCIDTVAASGGYMMACIANRIVAAPFAIVGSIGVVAEFPNFNKLLHKFDIDYEQETAGEYKRTLSIFGDNTDPKARQKFQEQLEACHRLFCHHVNKYRPQLSIDEVSTGEYWHAIDGLKNHLVDEIGTSNEYIISRIDYMNVFEFKSQKKKSFKDKLLGASTFLYKIANKLY